MNNQLHMLLIDNSIIGVSLMHDFKKLGCNVDLIKDETLALQKACEHKYDIIFSNAWIQHENSGMQLISLIKQHAEINKDTPIYALDIDNHNEFIQYPKTYGITNCIPINNLDESLLYIKEIINNFKPVNKKNNESMPLLDYEKDFLLAKTLELIGNFHALLIGATSQSAEEIIKLFSNSPCDLDVAFNYELAKKKLVLNVYDLILINLDIEDLWYNASLVYFIRNFSENNRDTTIFGFGAENNDEYNEEVRICTHIHHTVGFPFKKKDVERMIRLARYLRNKPRDTLKENRYAK